MSISPDTRPTPRDQSRASVADRLLTALEGLAERHRALVVTPEHARLHLLRHPPPGA